MALSAWLIGSYRGLPAQTLTIKGHPEVITAGSRYLEDSTPALSLLSRVEGAMLAQLVLGASVVLLRNRKVRISAFGDFTIDWPVDNVLRNLLGFTANLSGANSYTAANVSPLLWSPGRTETPTMAPLGSLGHTRFAVFTAVSPLEGSISTVTHGSGRTFNQFNWSHVANARYQTVNELGGEWVTFWANCCALGRNFNLWRNVDESDASTDPVTLSTKLGPYAYSPTAAGLDWSFTRSPGANFQWTDRRHDCQVPVHVVPEY